jgi:hypothetical protein
MSASKITALETRVAELEKKVEALLSQKTTVPTTGGKVKKEKVKRAPTAWSLFVKHITSEMKAANPEGKLKLPDIAAEAKKRKDSGRYDEAHWKEMVSKLTA